MGEIRNRLQNQIGLGDDLRGLSLDGSDLLAEPAALSLAGLAFLLVDRLADRAAHLASLLVEPVNIGLKLPPEPVEFGKADHVSRCPAKGTVGRDEIDIFCNKAAIEHEGGSREVACRWTMVPGTVQY